MDAIEESIQDVRASEVAEKTTETKKEFEEKSKDTRELSDNQDEKAHED